MAEKISKKIILKLLKSNAIHQEDIEVYTYGIQLLVMMILDWSITFFIMLVIKQITMSIVYFIVFMSMRHQCGGYHAVTHLRCSLAFNIVYVISIWSALYFSVRDYIWLFVLGELINFCLLFLFAPIAHENKPVSAEQLMRHRTYGMILNVILTVIAAITMILEQNNLGWSILFAQISVSGSVFLQKIKVYIKKNQANLQRRELR